ncbi:MAG: hypothetical protein ACLQBX_07865 [Candidatus Limnocylindrales bacterium]
MEHTADPPDARTLRGSDSGPTGSSLDLRRVLAGIDRIAPARFATLVILGYVAVSLIAYLPAWPGDPSRLVGAQCACGDPVQQSWFLGWVPWAIVHGHNPFFTNWIDQPSGVNLAVNTEMPFLGLLAAPITFAAGSVASFGFLLWLAFPASATAAFFVLRRWTRSNLGSACGGLLYGFSPYIVGEGFRHLNLTFVPLPPLIFMALYEIFVEQRSDARRWGVALGLLVGAQYFISSEVLSTTAVVAVVAAAILLVARHRSVDRRRLRHALRALVPAVLVTGVLLSYPVYYFLAGPQRFLGPVQLIGNRYRIDLLGPIIPTSAQLLGPSALVSLGDKFTDGFYENGSYLGIALLLLVVWLLVRYRRDRAILLAGSVALVAYVLSLGPGLLVGNHRTGIPLPFDAIGRLPYLGNILPARFALYEQFFVAVVLALGIAHGARAVASRPSAQGVAIHARPRRRLRTITSRTAAQSLVAAVGAIALVSLLPAWPTPTTPVSVSTPRFFTSPAADRIPAGSVVLTYPFAVTPDDQAMLWQEAVHFRWKLVGGYALIPGPDGTVRSQPPALPPLRVQEFLAWAESGNTNSHPMTTLTLDGRLVADLRLYIRRYGIGTVVFDPVGRRPALALALFERALGTPTSIGGVDVWFQTARLAREPVRSRPR